MAYPPNALYTGGYSPGAQLFGVDGDWTIPDPDGLPSIHYPMQGDSILSLADIIIYSSGAGDYVPVPLGTFPNIQPWSANQQTFVIEQEFKVAQSALFPLPLNFPYYPAWSTGYQNKLSNGIVTPALNAAILVEIGHHDDIGGGFVKYRLKFATVPATRNEIEQFEYTYPSFQDVATGDFRAQQTLAVPSRLQFDYFVFDDLGILESPLFPAGNRLDSTTGIYPKGLIIPQQKYYANAAAVGNNLMQPNQPLTDASGPTAATVPGFTEYVNWSLGTGTSHGLPAEIVAESSTIRRWMGNIFERRTRFVEAI